MSSEWPLVRLDDYVDSCLGKMLDAKKNKGIPQPYLGNSNVRWGAFELTDLAEMKFEPHEEQRYGLLPGDLVVCEGGEPGRCAIWTGAAGMKVQKALHRIRTKPQLNNYFLYYWFCYATRNEALEAYFTGTTIKHLTGKAIAELKVPLPPLSVQEGITDILKCLDDRITLLRETNTTLEAIAQALFKSWFVDFNPVHAKQQGRAPDGMDAQTAALFPDSFEESELGMVPKGWKITTIDGLASIKGGKQLEKENFKSDGRYPIFGGAGVMGYSDLFNAEGFLIVVGRVGAYCGQFFWLNGKGWINNNASLISVKEKNNSIFLLHCLKSFDMNLIKKGAAQPFISNGDISALNLVMPPERLINKFNEIANPIFDNLGASVSKLNTLTSIRDTLLPRLISGQLRLPEAQALVEDAVDA